MRNSVKVAFDARTSPRLLFQPCETAHDVCHDMAEELERHAPCAQAVIGPKGKNLLGSTDRFEAGRSH